MELSKKLKGLEANFPGLTSSMHLVSCEEDVQDLEEYVSEAPGPEAFREEVEKEHVLLAIHVLVDGRRGVLLADPGYHIARAVTVMADRAYPHTGRFIQSEEPHCRKEYEYRLNGANHNYVEWRERETRGQNVKEHVALVYVARPYLAAVSVTQRRNLVYNFRSLLTRNQKGQLTAGIYFPVVAKDQQFTIFYENSSEKKRIKMRFATFLDGAKVPEQALQQIATCNSQMLLGDGKLLKMIHELAVVMSDSAFIGDLLNIDKSIREVRYT